MSVERLPARASPSIIWGDLCGADHGATVLCSGGLRTPGRRDTSFAMPGLLDLAQLESDGSMLACGRDSRGQVACLGFGFEEPVEVDLSALIDGPVVQLAIEGTEICLLDDDRRSIRCGIADPLVDPVVARDATFTTSGEELVAIAGHTREMCALTISGEIWCWPGPGGEPGRVDVPSATALDGTLWGYFCALTEDGAVFCWGWDSGPAARPALTGVVAIEIDDLRACAITENLLTCWERPTPLPGSYPPSYTAPAEVDPD